MELGKAHLPWGTMALPWELAMAEDQTQGWGLKEEACGHDVGRLAAWQSQPLLKLAPSLLGYYVGMCFAASEKQLYYPSQTPETWRAFLLLALMLPAITCTLIYYWSRDRWAHHPLARTLALYALPWSGWRAVASSVNTEFRRIDKFATGVPGARVIVTDTWVMKVTTYRVHVAQQQDVHLTVMESQQHDLSPDSNLPVQLLTIRVASANPAVQAFDIR